MIQSKLRSVSVILGVLLSLGAGSSAWARDLRVALVLDKGGKDDKSFNAAAFKGAMRAKDELKAFVKYVEATDENAFESLLRSFAQKDFDIIFSIGVTQADAMRKVSAQFPQDHFVLVDAEVKAPNVRSILFEEHQGSYLMGAAAALSSKSGKVGFIGGMDIPLIRRFQMGYEAGAKKINPAIKVISNYIGITGDAWNNPAKGKELAVSQFDSGSDVIFAVAGASNSGVFDAAEEKSKLAIGVDSNQNWIKPGRILTSMLKRIDLAVFTTCQEAAKGSYPAGVINYGLDTQGVDYALDQNNEKIFPEAMRAKIDALKAEIIAGKIKVPDYYTKKN